MKVSTELCCLWCLQVQVDNDESDESYESAWAYVQHIQSNALMGHDRRSFHKEVTDNKVTCSPLKTLLKLKPSFSY